MNKDTITVVNEVRNKKWYRKNLVLGDGGWPAMRVFASNWKEYILYIDYAEFECIIAESDEIARNAFHELFDLSCLDYSIVMVETIYTTIESN